MHENETNEWERRTHRARPSRDAEGERRSSRAAGEREMGKKEVVGGRIEGEKESRASEAEGCNDCVRARR